MLLLAAWPVAQAADRDALRHIVEDECLPHWHLQHDPAPCAQIVLPGEDSQRGVAIVADRKGGAHYLLIPTQTLSGIEDPGLLRDHTPNYFAAAWQARERLDAVVGHPLRRDSIGLAINSALARGQDQLHIHIECLRPAVYQALHGAAARTIGRHWGMLPVESSPFRALRVMGQDLGEVLRTGREPIGDYTVIVAGMQFAEGPGFLILAGPTPTRAEVLLGMRSGEQVAPGETLLDSSCAVDR